MPQGRKQLRGATITPAYPAALPVAAAAIAAAAAATAAAIVSVVWRRRHQPSFRSVYADTTDRPFPHLAPQLDGEDADSSGGNGGGDAGFRSAAGYGPRPEVTAAAAAAVPTRLSKGTEEPFDGVATAVAAREGSAAVAAPPPPGGTRQRAADSGAAATSGPLVHPYLSRIQRLMGATECPVLRHPPPPPPAPTPPSAGVAPTRGSLPGFQVHWVSTPKQLYGLGQRLRQERQIGIDTEASPLLCYHGRVCLLQLSACDISATAAAASGRSTAGTAGGGVGGGSGGDVWLVDALALRDHVGPALAELMADPRVIKVVHGGSNDVMWLQRDFRLYPVNVYDTEKAAQVLGYESRALTSLLLRCCGLDLTADKAAGQRADWRRRPLPPALLRYAAADVAYLPYLADILRRELAGLGRPGDPPGPVGAVQAISRGDAAAGLYGSGSCPAGAGGDVGVEGSRYVLAPLVMMQPPGMGLAAVAASSEVSEQSTSLPAPPPGQQQQQQQSQTLTEAVGAAGGPYGAGAAVARPVLTPLGHALLRSHQLSLTMYRKPISDAAAAAAVAATAAASGRNAAAPPSGTATSAAAAVLRKLFSVPTVASAGHAAGKGRNAAAAATAPTGPAATSTHVNPVGMGLTAAAAADAVLALCRWRDATARRLDFSAQLLLPDVALAALAAARPPPADARALLQLVSERIAAANQVLQAEPYAARYEMCTALRDQAKALSGLLTTVAAGGGGGRGRMMRIPAAAAEEEVADANDAAAAAAVAFPFQPVGFGAAGLGRRTRHDPAAAQERRSWLIDKFSAKTQVYQNCRMLSREGELLCFCDTRKLGWYLSKGLAVQVCEEPPTIQLLFEHQNTDQQMGADDFYSQSKANRCVACGCSSHYLRYRVLPACYRRHMPPALKSHRSHDVVLLCIDCHERAQKAAEQLKRQVAVDYGVPLLPPRTPVALQAAHTAAGGAGGVGADGARSDGDSDGFGAGGEGESGGGDGIEGLPGGVHPSSARRAALALQKSGGRMPPERIRQLEGLIKMALGRDPAAAEEEPGLRPGDLEAALLAGLGRRGRNKYLRGQQQQQPEQQEPREPQQRPQQPQQKQQLDKSLAEGEGGQPAGAGVIPTGGGGSGDGCGGVQGTEGAARDAVEPASTATATTSASRDSGRTVDRWLDSGHLWHGERVVRRAMQRGGEEELLQLIKRFRARFVEAVGPQYLPPSWGVDHAARRDFGPYSVYARESRRQGEVDHGTGERKP